MKHNYAVETRTMNNKAWDKLIPTRKREVVCPKCGLNSWTYKYGVVKTSIPPIYVDHYECSGCGYPYTKTVKGEQFPAPIELFEGDEE